jgi:hypothetical protein
MGEPDKPENLVTDAEGLGGTISAPEVGRIRREFMSACAIAMVAATPVDGERGQANVELAWTWAEELLGEGQKRGHLP